MKSFLITLAGAGLLLSGSVFAQEAAYTAPEGASQELIDALKPQPDLGDRLLSEQSEEVQEIIRTKLIEESNRPLAPAPQHLTVSSARTAHVCESPAETCLAVVPRLTAGRLPIPLAPGAAPQSVVESCPNCPLPPRPQHLTVSSSRTAHV